MSKLTNGSLKDLIKQVIKEEAELENLVEVGSPQPTDPAQVKARAAGQPYKVGATLVYPKEWLFKKGPAAVAQVKALVQGGRATIEGFAVQQAAEATLSGEWDALFDMESAADTAASAKAGHASGDTPMPKGSDARDLGGPPASLKPKAKKAKRGGRGVRFTGAGKKAIGGVKQLQAYLFSKGFGGKNRKKFVDGVNGPGTLKALIAFQKAQKTVKVDGVVGKDTAPLLLPKSEADNVKLQKDRAAQDPAKKAGTRKGRRFIPDAELDAEDRPGGGYGLQNVADRHRGPGGQVRVGAGKGMRENNITKTQRKPNKMINEKQLLNVIKRVVREEMQTLSEVLPGQLSEPVAGGAPSPWPARPGKRAKKKKRVVATRTGKAALRSMAQPGERNWIATLQRLLWPLSQGEQENVAWDPGVSESEFIDGRNGPLTATAVMMFQEDQGITPDGIVGPDTIDRIVAAVGAGEDLPPLEEPGQGVPAVPAPEVDPGSEELVASRAQMRRDGLAESRSPFRKELLEEVCGVPAKRYKIKRR